MRLLLVGILVFLPLAAQAENIDKLSANESDPSPVFDPFSVKNLGDPNSVINELGLYGNPYSPASATNFEAIPASSRYDQGRLSTNLYNPDWLRNPFGHYGTPYSPNQFNNR
jgi:hypothetical protein